MLLIFIGFIAICFGLGWAVVNQFDRPGKE